MYTRARRPHHKFTRIRAARGINPPPVLPQKTNEVTTNTKTACRPFITPAALVAPPGKFFNVYWNEKLSQTWGADQQFIIAIAYARAC